MAVTGDEKYLAILDELRELHLKKSADYGSDEDALANLRFCVKGTLACEGVEDTLLDMAAYACLVLRLYREGVTQSPAVTLASDGQWPDRDKSVPLSPVQHVLSGAKPCQGSLVRRS